MPSLLIVEDDVSSADAIALLAQYEGFRARVVRTRREAIDAVKSEPFDAILLDLWLAESSGVDAGTAIHDEVDTPIIIMSAAPEDQLQDAIRRTGAAGALRKPFDLRTLRRALAEATGTVPREPGRAARVFTPTEQRPEAR
jgi:two-component system, OmpR family, response regulator QseB